MADCLTDIINAICGDPSKPTPSSSSTAPIENDTVKETSTANVSARDISTKSTKDTSSLATADSSTPADGDDGNVPTDTGDLGSSSNSASNTQTLPRHEILPGHHTQSSPASDSPEDSVQPPPVAPPRSRQPILNAEQRVLRSQMFMSPLAQAETRFLSDAVSQADDLKSNFEVGVTLGTGSFSRIRLALLKGQFFEAGGFGKFVVSKGKSGETNSPHSSKYVHNIDDICDMVCRHPAGVDLLPFAMKILRKRDIVELRQEEHTMSERAVLELLKNHPFIVQMYRSYQDEKFLYMVLEYVPGGEVFQLLHQYQKFPKELTFFYMCQLVLVFEHMHKFDIAYRDVKPENFLIDHAGYIRVVDFGFSTFLLGGKTYTVCGTPEYLAPEVLLSEGHDCRVDWWALGAFFYEMLSGTPPFFSPEQDLHYIYQQAINNDVSFTPGMTEYEKQVIKGLVNKDPDARLKADSLKALPYFHDTPWGEFLNKDIPAPHQPVLESPIDTSNFEEYPDSVEPADDIPVDPDLFEGFENAFEIA